MNYKRFSSENISNLHKLKHSNPRKFWKILNKKKHATFTASLNDFYSHFKHVNSQNEDFVNNENNSNSCVQGLNECTCRNHFTPYNTDVLNSHITLKEVKDAIKSLKLNKASGDDDIVPKSWTIGVLNPILKNNGSANDPTYYRPVTLLSCLGKLFTNILNSRLQLVCDSHDIINQFQTVFRKQHYD